MINGLLLKAATVAPVTGTTTEAIATMVVVVAMFALFIREIYPPEVVALAGASVLLAMGVLPYDHALSVLSNPATL